MTNSSSQANAQNISGFENLTFLSNEMQFESNVFTVIRKAISFSSHDDILAKQRSHC